jgi:pimeloyl-ACP methyl ester carboxylesterase
MGRLQAGRLRGLLVVGLAAGLFVVSIGATHVYAADIDASAYLHPHQMVALANGRRLNMFCMGQGAPTVILEAGLGSSLSDWRKVQGAISGFTQVCAYERAGYGFSDPAPGPADVARAAADLHLLIRKGRISTPFVLVGHSIGGFFATVYAATHPHEVAGMVLIDPSFAGQGQRAMAGWTKPQLNAAAEQQNQTLMSLRKCLDIAKVGGFAKPENQKSDCIDNPPDPDPVLHQALNQEYSQPSTIEAILDEEIAFTPSVPGGLAPDDVQGFAAKASFGDMKLIVLTAANKTAGPTWTPQQINDSTAAWQAGHDELAGRSSRGVNIVVAKSGHFIQKDQPEAVLRAVRDVVDDVRKH